MSMMRPRFPVLIMPKREMVMALGPQPPYSIFTRLAAISPTSTTRKPSVSAPALSMDQFHRDRATDSASFRLARHQLGIARLCSHLKHDFAWSVARSTVLERFACAGKRKDLG